MLKYNLRASLQSLYSMNTSRSACNLTKGCFFALLYRLQLTPVPAAGLGVGGKEFERSSLKCTLHARAVRVVTCKISPKYLEQQASRGNIMFRWTMLTLGTGLLAACGFWLLSH